MGGVTLRAGMNPEEEKLPFRKKGQSRAMKFRLRHRAGRDGDGGRVQPRDGGRRDPVRARVTPGRRSPSPPQRRCSCATPVQRKGTSAVYALAILATWWALFRRVRFRPSLIGPMLCVMTFVGLLFIAIPRYRAPYHAYVFLLAAGGVVRERTQEPALRRSEPS